MIAPWAYPGSCACLTSSTSAAFYKMWNTVINRYVGNPNVCVEIDNEPNGFSNGAWDSCCRSRV
jgi:hypothetical protein